MVTSYHGDGTLASPVVPRRQATRVRANQRGKGFAHSSTAYTSVHWGSVNRASEGAGAGGGCSRFRSQRPQHGGLGGIGKHLWNVVELLPHIHHEASLTCITLPFIPFPGRAPKKSLAGLRRLARRRSRLPCPGCQASLHREQRTTRRPQPSTTHLETLPGCSQQEQGKRDQSTVTPKNTSSL